MKIETMFDIGDHVFYIRDGKPHKARIKNANIVISENWLSNRTYRIEYFIREGVTSFSHGEWIGQWKIFKSKTELLASL